MIDNIVQRLNALADPVRCRLLLALENQELMVTELRSALQMPQSTVSRHLKVLNAEGWVTSRASGASNWYRMNTTLAPSARKLWEVVRGEFAGTPPAVRDTQRIQTIIAARRGRSREFFASTAGRWDRLRIELFGEGIEWLAIGSLLDPHWTVGDLGTGTGQLAATIAPFVREVLAVDESPVMLAAARERTKGCDNVFCREGTLEALPIDTASLDVALILLVLHHLPEPAKAVAEAARALKPEGRLIIVDMMSHERADYRETMGHQWFGFDELTVAHWCEAAQLEVVNYRSLTPRSPAQGPVLFAATARKPIPRGLPT